MRHSLRQFAGFTAVCAMLPLLAMSSAPVASAQTYATPTPQPAIEATRQAAQAQLDAANAQQQQAAQMEAQAAQMRRNGEAQAAQAQADIAAAREAQAVQNGVAVGEAIGRVESTLNQLRDTVAGQADIITRQSDTISAQAAQHISDTLELQSLRTDKATISAAYAATVARAQEAEKASGNTSPLVWFVALAIIGCGGMLLIVVLQRKPSIVQAAPVAYDVGRYDEVIEGE
jgi:hypothetical protein